MNLFKLSLLPFCELIHNIMNDERQIATQTILRDVFRSYKQTNLFYVPIGFEILAISASAVSLATATVGMLSIDLIHLPHRRVCCALSFPRSPFQQRCHQS
jgi:hypothetical protein